MGELGNENRGERMGEELTSVLGVEDVVTDGVVGKKEIEFGKIEFKSYLDK